MRWWSWWFATDFLPTGKQHIEKKKRNMWYPIFSKCQGVQSLLEKSTIFQGFSKLSQDDQNFPYSYQECFIRYYWVPSWIIICTCQFMIVLGHTRARKKNDNHREEAWLVERLAVLTKLLRPGVPHATSLRVWWAYLFGFTNPTIRTWHSYQLRRQRCSK